MVDEFLELQVEFFALTEKVIQFLLSEDAAQGSLGHLACGVEVVFYGDNGFDGVHHLEEKDGVHMDADIIAGDDILGGDIQGVGLEADFANGVNGPENEDDAGAFCVAENAPETEDNTALIFV